MQLEPGREPDGCLADIVAPTLVVHGTDDPLFPLGHGQALATAIPNATLLPLQGVGHELPPPADWDTFVTALLQHTAGGLTACLGRTLRLRLVEPIFYSRLGDPDAWDWAAVNSCSRALNRRIRKAAIRTESSRPVLPAAHQATLNGLTLDPM